jgi:hypothetical protein
LQELFRQFLLQALDRNILVPVNEPLPFRPPSDVAAQFAVESAGNATPGTSPVGGQSKGHSIALFQASPPTRGHGKLGKGL